MARVVLTGGNRGIGLAMAGLFKERGDEVSVLCRQSSSALAALGVHVLENIDVTDQAAIRDVPQQLGESPIDILVNNAGIMRSSTLQHLEVEGIREQFEVNAIAPLFLAWSLLDRLSPNAKLAFITSRMGSIADNTSGGSYGYRMSKTALNMAATSLSHDLAPRNISVAILHPGYVQTDMTRNTGDVSPEFSAAGLIQRIDELTPKTTGTFWHAQGEVLPW